LKILGFIAAKEVLSAADIFLSTSLNEGIPYSILEAQSAGLPVVAVKAGALPEIISEGVNGYLVEPNAEKIVAKLMELRANPKLLEEMSLAARESVSSEDSCRTLSTRHIELYRRISNRS
jgi:glycosyltransferase involved in cell wall biosynthesis